EPDDLAERLDVDRRLHLLVLGAVVERAVHDLLRHVLFEGLELLPVRHLLGLHLALAVGGLLAVGLSPRVRVVGGRPARSLRGPAWSPSWCSAAGSPSWCSAA